MDGGSQYWKHMLIARDNIDQVILRETKCGHYNIWTDNWTQLGAPQYYLLVNHNINKGFNEVN